MREPFQIRNLTAVAMSLTLWAAFPAYGQDKPIVDPVDPLAKPATPVVVPRTLLDNMEAFQTPETVEKAYPLPQDPKTIVAVRTARFQHLNEDVLSRYNKSGNTVKPWAGKVRKAIEAYSWAYTRTSAQIEGVYYQAFLEALQNIDADCKEPLIEYWRLRHLENSATVFPKDLPKQKLILDNLIESNASPLTAIHAAYTYRVNVHRLGQLENSQIAKKDIDDSDRKYELAMQVFVPIAKPLDYGEIVQVSLQEIVMLMGSGQSRLDAWKIIDRRLLKLKAASWIRDTLEGKVLTEAGWDARGSGAGNTVDPEDYEVFRTRLKQAKTKLEAAWKAEPSLHQPPTFMLYVAKGLAFPREEMETWFRRAMETNPDNFEACDAKKEWLQSHWHGYNSTVINFVVQCMRTNNFYGKLPYVAEIPYLRGLPFHDRDGLKDYVSRVHTFQPFETVAEAHLKRYPADRWARSRYAYHACLWKQWEIADRQLPFIGEKSWAGWFPREGEFEKAKILIREGLKKPNDN